MISILGQNIKRIRINRGIKTTQLSKRAKVGISTISQIESGSRQSLKSDTLNKIVEALNVSVEDLISDKTAKRKSYDISCIINEIKENEITFEGKSLTKDEIKLIELNLEVALKSVQLYRSKKGI
ncbi:helix-turn-helix domain-containing protein [Clostridium sp. M14]|uniref:helix-turn-helix domain-containing protein n=1 Tax=Clostridium sp. M14 TaxID=2716311 RepID=UPI0013EE5F9C|nr:helix-turn-helix transcriptional regulator [Clostridium sp. M14]MBZ9693335.1 helix-turn-helix domain-containing protein [Clostridium sp. M14]